MVEVDLYFDKECWTEVNEENYRREVLESERPTLVEFWGPKCKDCQAIATEVHRLSKEYFKMVKFCHFKCPSRFAVLELGVRHLPTFYFYKDGKRVKSLTKESANVNEIEKTLKSISEMR